MSRQLHGRLRHRERVYRGEARSSGHADRDERHRSVIIRPDQAFIDIKLDTIEVLLLLSEAATPITLPEISLYEMDSLDPDISSIPMVWARLPRSRQARLFPKPDEYYHLVCIRRQTLRVEVYDGDFHEGSDK